MGVLHAGLHGAARWHPRGNVHDGNIVWLGVVHEDQGQSSETARRQYRSQAQPHHGKDRTTILGWTMTGFHRFFGFDLCLRLKRLDWFADEADRIVTRMIDRGK